MGEGGYRGCNERLSPTPKVDNSREERSAFVTNTLPRYQADPRKNVRRTATASAAFRGSLDLYFERHLPSPDDPDLLQLLILQTDRSLVAKGSDTIPKLVDSGSDVSRPRGGEVVGFVISPTDSDRS